MGLWETLEEKLRRRQRSGYFTQTSNYSFYSDSRVLRESGAKIMWDLDRGGRKLLKWLRKQGKDIFP